METKELIQALRADAEWAYANEWETPIMLGDHLDAAADALATLLAEVERLVQGKQELIENREKWIKAHGELSAEVERLNSEMQLENTQPKPDGKCREDDGCPTENAVLRREWRTLTEQLASVTAERDAAENAVAKMAEYIVTLGGVDYHLCDVIPQEHHLKYQPKNDGDYDNEPCIECVKAYFMSGAGKERNDG